MIEKYEKYLEIIGENLLKTFFENQKDYIFCKIGCSSCCEKGEYPFSKLEFGYAMLGYDALTEVEKSIINSKVKEIKTQKNISKANVFEYECPFLIEKKCSIYKHRGIICRTHGLMFFLTNENGKIENKCPNCVDIGLNYSNVFDKEKGIISEELWEKTGIKEKPLIYNLSQRTVLDNDITKQLEIDFGETKALIDWF